MNIHFPCALHPDSKALQISKCAAHHQLCGPCWTAAYKSRHCPICQDALEELMPEPICEYRIDKFKLATKVDFRHHLPCELLDEIIKFCGLECFPRSAYFCRPKNVALLVANSALNAFATKQLKLKADYYFKCTLTTLLASTRIRDSIKGSTISERELEKIVVRMLQNKGKYLNLADELLEIDMNYIQGNIDNLMSYLRIIEMLKALVEDEIRKMNIIDKK